MSGNGQTFGGEVWPMERIGQTFVGKVQPMRGIGQTLGGKLWPLYIKIAATYATGLEHDTVAIWRPDRIIVGLINVNRDSIPRTQSYIQMSPDPEPASR